MRAQQQFDANLHAGPQRQRATEHEGRAHQVGAVLPGNRNAAREHGDEARQQRGRDLRQREQRQRGEARGREVRRGQREPVDTALEGDQRARPDPRSAIGRKRRHVKPCRGSPGTA
ncbi:hypothetical protein LP416_04685 [Polaromonas sp. P2-4]|nr:hypothetical protein LP416_04685 [Polaromonas sp. P2-4]